MDLTKVFAYIFEADASALKKGLDDADNSTKKTEEGLSRVDKSAEDVGKKFISLAKSAAGFFGVALSFSAIKGMAIASAELTGELAKQSRELNINADNLLVMKNAAVAAGGTAEGFANTWATLTRRTRDPERALFQLSDRFKGLSRLRAVRLAEMLGLDTGIVDMLTKGRKGIEDIIRRQQELGQVTKEQIEVSEKFNAQLRDTNTVFEDVKRIVSTAILPIFTDFLKAIERVVIFLRDNEDLVKGFFIAVAAIVLANFLPAIMSAAAGVWALIAPFAVVIGIVALVASVFALLYDDVMNFLKGNDSMIGRLSKDYPWIGELVKGMANAFSQFWELIKQVGSFLLSMFVGPKAALEAFKLMFQSFLNLIFGNEWGKSIFDWLGAQINMVLGWITSLSDKWKSFKNWVTGGSGESEGIEPNEPGEPDWMAEARKAREKTVSSSALSLSDGKQQVVQQGVANGQAAIAQAQANPVGAGLSSQAISNTTANRRETTVNMNGDIIVNAEGADAEGVAAGAGNALSGELKKTANSFAGGNVS